LRLSSPTTNSSAARSASVTRSMAPLACTDTPSRIFCRRISPAWRAISSTTSSLTNKTNLLFPFLEHAPDRQQEKHKGGTHKYRNAARGAEDGIAESEHDSEVLLEASEHRLGGAGKGFRQGDFHHHLPKEDRGVGDGKQLDRCLDPAGEHADGHVDAGKKAGERADDGAGHRKGVGRFDERNKKGDESPTCDRRKHDQAQSFQHRRQGQELAAIGPDEDL